MMHCLKNFRYHKLPLILCKQKFSGTAVIKQAPALKQQKQQYSGQKKPLLENSGAHENY